jgi:hypothetical protein
MFLLTAQRCHAGATAPAFDSSDDDTSNDPCLILFEVISNCVDDNQGDIDHVRFLPQHAAGASTGADEPSSVYVAAVSKIVCVLFFVRIVGA